jgi:peptide/nickel transport system substrate-binding protein
MTNRKTRARRAVQPRPLRMHLGGLAAVAALGASLGLAAPAQAQTRVSIAVTETIASQNPYADSVALMYAVFCQTYGCLFDRNFDTGTFTSRIVERYETPEPTKWIFHLKRDVVRNNGEPVTAADVLHSIDRAKNDAQSKQRHNVRYIEAVEAPDDYTIVMTTTEPLATLLDFLRQLIITSKAQYEALGEAADRQAPVGFGPYSITELSVDNYIALAKVAGHGEVVAENPDEVIFRIIKEPESRVTALLNGEIQIAQFIPPQLVSRVDSSPNARLVWEDSTELMFLAMSPLFEPWDKREVRQAVAYAINRDAIIRAILQGHASRLDGPIGPGQVGWDPEFDKGYPYDPDKARQLLAEAGYPDGVEIDYYTPVGRYTADKQISEAIVPMLEAVGFKVNLQTPEWGTLWSSVQNGGVPFYYMGRGSVVDPSAALSQYFETGASPRIGFSHPEVDALLQRERQTFDHDERMKVLREAMELITVEAPAHFMWRHKFAWGLAPEIDYKPLPTTEILANAIFVRADRRATR